MLKLQQKQQPHRSFWLVEPAVTLGSADTDTVKISGADVKAAHITVQVSGEELTLVAAGPGVAVNGVVAAVPRRLGAGDQVRVCGQSFLVVDPKQADAPLPASTSESSAWVLVNGDAAPYTLRNGAVLGRASSCDITLASPHLSRQHARFQWLEGSFWVEDLNSLNGTFLNGRRVLRAPLRAGDKLRFDEREFEVQQLAEGRKPGIAASPDVAREAALSATVSRSR